MRRKSGGEASHPEKQQRSLSLERWEAEAYGNRTHPPGAQPGALDLKSNFTEMMLMAIIPELSEIL
jgi:hypothetical protein